ncbi:Flagellar motor rotation protein MotB [Candidatus Hydrogenisulfobacillus filiaventi]|uniref:Flagellar motor rotation protein MotB n=1 Tax=Candidatus Hydrogenisulfobacillus filiaventi TaxID=2707344 RepID=A0A6F8ZE27_9FIRM|nr:OmpA family protein [Bacillota bacterium]CAB1128005.1 Flagellar motor rotation protein MotB [Candidatus Hydrogenisulfobacillus filiaventi]
MNGRDRDNQERPPESAGSMRWLLTYSDLITLLLAFFIILYALSQTEAQKFQLLSQALAQEFDSRSVVGVSPGPSIITGRSGTRAAEGELKTLSRLEDALQARVTRAGLGGQVAVTSTPRGVEVSLNASLLFPSGSARLSPKAVALIRSVGQVLKTVPNDIEVAGYTDSRPIRTAQYPSNWQLSAMRAANVVWVLAQVPGIRPQRLSLAGFGRYHPVASNATPAGRQANRRVNILVLRPSVGEVAIGQGP